MSKGTKMYDDYLEEKCANCNNLKPIYKHPKNDGKGKGNIIELMGYGCGVWKKRIVFLDRDDGMCELFTNKINE